MYIYNNNNNNNNNNSNNNNYIYIHTETRCRCRYWRRVFLVCNILSRQWFPMWRITSGMICQRLWRLLYRHCHCCHVLTIVFSNVAGKFKPRTFHLKELHVSFSSSTVAQAHAYWTWRSVAWRMYVRGKRTWHRVQWGYCPTPPRPIADVKTHET